MVAFQKQEWADSTSECPGLEPQSQDLPDPQISKVTTVALASERKEDHSIMNAIGNYVRGLGRHLGYL
jgi:hypothetical protein